MLLFALCASPALAGPPPSVTEYISAGAANLMTKAAAAKAPAAARRRLSEYNPVA